MTAPSDSDRRRTVIVRFALVCAAIVVLLLALVGALVTAFVLYFGLSYDDPSDYNPPAAPAVSAEQARQLASEELCPEAPATIAADLIAEEESGDYRVYLRARPEVAQPQNMEPMTDDLATLFVGGRGRLIRRESINVAEFANYIRASCATTPATSD